MFTPFISNRRLNGWPYLFSTAIAMLPALDVTSTSEKETAGNLGWSTATAAYANIK